MAGFFSGKLNSDTSWHKKQEAQEQAYANKISLTLKKNQSLIESYTTLKLDYNNNVQEKLNVIEQNKKLIAHNNVITRQFVQYTTLLPSRVQSNNSESATNPDGRVSAVQYGKWILGLESHDQQCINQLNMLIKATNNQGSQGE